MRVTLSKLLCLCAGLGAANGCSKAGDGSNFNRGQSVDATAAGDPSTSDSGAIGWDRATLPTEPAAADAPVSADAVAAEVDSQAAIPDSSGDMIAANYSMQLQWSFPDLTTHIGPDEIFLSPGTLWSAPLDVLEDYAKQIALYTWPEREPVPFQTVAFSPPPGGLIPESRPKESPKVFVHFAPPTTAPRWYLVEVTPGGRLEMLQRPGTYPVVTTWRRLPSGTQDGGIPETVGVRFMTASYPRVQYVTEGLSHASIWQLALEFSEVVDIRSLVAVVHLAEPAKSVCTLSPQYADPSQPSTGTSIFYYCTSSVLKGLSFTIDSPVIVNGPTFLVPADDASLSPWTGEKGRIYFFPVAGE